MASIFDRTIAALGVAATLLVGWVTLNATLDVASWGGTPPKKLEAQFIGPTDPLSDLSDKTGLVDVSVKNQGKEVRNICIVHAILQNKGASPILPGDMTEPLSLTVDAPWRIIGVANANATSKSGPRLKWNRVNDQQFSTEKALINPDDLIWSTVYLSWDGKEEPEKSEVSPLTWGARITNLKGIEVVDKSLDSTMDKIGPIMVNVWGWGVPFLIFSFVLYSWLTTLLLVKSGFLSVNSPISLSLVPLSAALNLSAAEAGTSFMFGSNPYITSIIPSSYNFPPLIINAAMMVLLYWRWHHRSEI